MDVKISSKTLKQYKIDTFLLNIKDKFILNYNVLKKINMWYDLQDLILIKHYVDYEPHTYMCMIRNPDSRVAQIVVRNEYESEPTIRFPAYHRLGKHRVKVSIYF